MSNFRCQMCGTDIVDSPNGYVTGCVHYPLYHDVPKKNPFYNLIRIGLVAWVAWLTIIVFCHMFGYSKDHNECDCSHEVVAPAKTSTMSVSEMLQHRAYQSSY